MPRKKPAHDQSKREGFVLYCDKAEQAAFTRAAKADGFNSRNAWVLYHLRKLLQAKKP